MNEIKNVLDGDDPNSTTTSLQRYATHIHILLQS